jgi:hypothetical protein
MKERRQSRESAGIIGVVFSKDVNILHLYPVAGRAGRAFIGCKRGAMENLLFAVSTKWRAVVDAFIGASTSGFPSMKNHVHRYYQNQFREVLSATWELHRSVHS